MKDNIVPCGKCGQHLCYQTEYDNMVVWKCMACGYTTNSYMMNNTEQVAAFAKEMPTMFDDIKFVDKDGLVWYPNVINLPDKGTIFPDPVGESWKWAVALAVPLNKEELAKFKATRREETHKVDYGQVMHFDQDKYLYALEALGLI